MIIKDELIKIVGDKYLLEDNKKLKPYSQDGGFSVPHMPSYVARPKNAEEVQKIVRLANEIKLPIVPSSSGIHFNGNTIPAEGGIVLDLRRMNRILNVDERNRVVRFEAGVTWEQVQRELEKYDLMALSPLLPHPLKSALTSHLEREPMLIPKFEYYDNLINVEVVLPSGELFRTGSTCVPGFPDKSLSDGVNPVGPSIVMWPRLLQGAQGTMGIVTWAQVKAEYRPKVNKTFFIPFNSVNDAAQFVYRVQRRMIGEECLVFNNTNLASILAKQWPEEFDKLKAILSPWTVVLVLGGGKRFPENRIEYEEEALREVAVELSISDLSVSVTSIPEVEKEIPDILRNAWPRKRIYWKFAYKGSCQDLFFHTVLNKASTFTQSIGEIAVKNNYPMHDIGFYIQPLVYGGACHFECNFYYDHSNTKEVDRIKNLFAEAAETVLDKGGFFTRPYGLIADMVYSRTTGYTTTLRKVKKMLDPNNIMSPGRLCF